MRAIGRQTFGLYESGRGRAQDREGLGPVRQRRRGGQGPGGGRGRGRGPGQGARPTSTRPGARDRARGQDNVEKPRTDEQATSGAGREQPVVEPAVETTPQEVAQAPDTTTPKKGHDDPTKLDQSGDPSQESSGGEGSGSPPSKGGRS